MFLRLLFSYCCRLYFFVLSIFVHKLFTCDTFKSSIRHGGENSELLAKNNFEFVVTFYVIVLLFFYVDERVDHQNICLCFFSVQVF